MRSIGLWILVAVVAGCASPPRQKASYQLVLGEGKSLTAQQRSELAAARGKALRDRPDLPPFPPDDLPDGPIEGWPPSGGGGKSWGSYLCGRDEGIDQAKCVRLCAEAGKCLFTCFTYYDELEQQCVTAAVCGDCDIPTDEGPTPDDTNRSSN